MLASNTFEKGTSAQPLTTSHDAFRTSLALPDFVLDLDCCVDVRFNCVSPGGG
jgi:hypothetical protein